MNWKLLAIEPTKDKKAITAAYRAQLSHTNPEDKPEEFKALRAAYEEALRLAEEPETEMKRDKSPIGLWTEKLRALYGDYARRIRPEGWKELLEEDVCVALDKRPQTEEALLRFLMEDYFLPQEVWQLLDETFSWSRRREELYETYPKDFVDYAVMNGIRYSASLPYDMFTPGVSAEECDEYRRLYYRASRASAQEMEPLLVQMESLSESHPYGRALRCRLMLEQGDVEGGREGYRRLAAEYPGDVTLAMSWASQCVAAELWEEGEKQSRRALEMKPEQWQAKELLADCLGHMDRQDEAKELIFQLMHAAGGDQRRNYMLTQTVRRLNDSIIPRRETQMQEHPEDEKNIVELAWCYLQNDRKEEAVRLCQSLDPAYEDQYEYHNLLAKTYNYADMPAEALAHIEALVDILRDMQPDGSEEMADRLKRLPEMLQIQGSLLFQLGREEEGMEKYREALKLGPDDGEVLTRMGLLLYGQKNYEEAAELFERLTALMPGSYHGYYMLAMSLYELERDRDAFDAINRALDLERGDLGTYVLKMRILLRNGVWEQVKETLEFLDANGVGDDISVLWCKAQIKEFADKDKDGALTLYQKIADRLESGESLTWGASVYFRITVLLSAQKDARRAEDRAALLTILEKGLSLDKDDFNCLDYKAWLLKRDQRFEESLEIYHKLEKRKRRNLDVERELAEIYYKDLNRNAEKALHYYQLLAESSEDAELYFYTGNCRWYLGDLAGAERDFRRENELDRMDVDAYNGLGIVLEAQGRNMEALIMAEKAIALTEGKEGNRSRYYFRKIQILRRLGRWEEAISTVDALVEKCGYDHGDKMKVEICFQFGLWEEARQYLSEWQAGGEQKSEKRKAQIRLDIFTRRVYKARAAVALGGTGLDGEDRAELKMQMADLDGEPEPQIKYWMAQEKAKTKQGRETSYELMNLAQVLTWTARNDKDRALGREYAQKALRVIDSMLESRLLNETLYRGRRCIVLAILGRMEEARAELEKMRSLPLCASCDYCRCKDSDIFEANLEELSGNYEKAFALYMAGIETWPDDTDFICGERRMRRKKL